MTAPTDPAPMEYAGFHKHKRGRIHLFCPHCGLKRSNMPRGDMDPPTATLVAIPCEACSDGCKVDGPSFYRDAEGRELCQFCGDHDCENASGDKDCDERLVNAEVERDLKAMGGS